MSIDVNIKGWMRGKERKGKGKVSVEGEVLWFCGREGKGRLA